MQRVRISKVLPLPHPDACSASLILLLALLPLASCAKAPEGAGKSRPPPYVVVERTLVRDVAVEVHAPVDLRPLEQADVGSKILGYVDAVLVDRGDRVKHGQMVALVRPSDLPDQLSAARHALVQIQANLGLARTNAERAAKLAPTGVVSQQELQQTSASVAASEAGEAAAKAQLAALAVRLGETRIESPLDGVVTIRRLDPGALVGPPGGGAIVTVARVDRLRVFISVNERDANGVTVGKEAHVEVDALGDRRFVGRVVRIAPTFDATTRTLEAEVQLDNRDGELRPGMYGRGTIVKEVHLGALSVPAASIQINAEERYVFVLTADKVKRQRISTGVDHGDWLEVTAGLSAGAEVVTAGADGLSDGATVRVARDIDPFTGAKLATSADAGMPTQKD